MAEQTYNIDLVPISNPVVVPVSQYDVNRSIIFNLLWNGVAFTATGYSAVLSGEFQNGKSFSIAGTVSGSKATFKCTAASTAFMGPCLAEVRISNGSTTLGSSNFLWKVEESPDLSKGVTADDISIFQQLLNQAQAAAGNAQNYANQANNYAQQAAASAASFKVPEWLTKRRYIFIGDSYGAGEKMYNPSDNWINRVIDYLGLSSSDYYKTAVSGSGFVGQSGKATFLEQLQNLSVSNKDTITDIVVLGGWNDTGAVGSDSIGYAIESFNKHVATNYPNATVWLGMVSWVDSYRWYNGGHTSGDFIWNLREVLEEYSWAHTLNADDRPKGFHYIKNMQYVLHDPSCFDQSDGGNTGTTDGLHPGPYGQFCIASALRDALLGSDIDVFHPYRADTMFTWNSSLGINTDQPVLYHYQNNDRVGVFISSRNNYGIQLKLNPSSTINIKAAGFGGGGTTIIDLGTFHENYGYCRGGRYNELSYAGPCMVYASGSWYEVQGLLRWSPYNIGNKLQFAVASTTGSSGYRTYNNVTEIWFPKPNGIHLEADAMYC